MIRQPTTGDVRSLFFVRPEGLEKKLPTFDGTTFILDIEDGVPIQHKPARRTRIRELLAAQVFQGRTVLLRVNGINAGVREVEQDLEICLQAGVQGLILPMLRTAEHVRLFDTLVAKAEHRSGLPAGSVAFYPLLEQTEGVLNAEAIGRASSRVCALCFGHADFLLSHVGDPGPAAVAAAWGPIILAASAVGVPAVASPYLDIRNLRGFRQYCRQMRELGFSGVFTLTPQQDAQARRSFSVTAAEAELARAIMAVDGDRSIGVVNGQMVGPPMVARARRVLARSEVAPAPLQSPVKGTIRRHGLDLSNVRVGMELRSPHEITIDDSWRTTWLSAFATSNRVVTSAPYAAGWGLPNAALPPGLLLNLTLCMSVEPFSQSCRLHLGLHDAVQLAPAAAGDTFRNFIRIESFRNTSRGDASVIETTHTLRNQRDECVYRLRKMSYFDPVPAEAFQAPTTPRAPDGPGMERLEAILRAVTAPPSAPGYVVEPGQVILHPSVRPIGWSENLALTTLFHNTHPVHFDTEHYPRDEIIVCGGFVQSMAFAAVESDLRQILTERLIHSSHINTVAPEDRIGAVSAVLSVTPVSEYLEEVRLKTLGLRNVDVERELVGLALPGRLFADEALKPSEVEHICRRQRPELEGRIALQATRVLLRPRAGGES